MEEYLCSFDLEIKLLIIFSTTLKAAKIDRAKLRLKWITLSGVKARRLLIADDKMISTWWQLVLGPQAF